MVASSWFSNIKFASTAAILQRSFVFIFKGKICMRRNINLGIWKFQKCINVKKKEILLLQHEDKLEKAGSAKVPERYL